MMTLMDHYFFRINLVDEDRTSHLDQTRRRLPLEWGHSRKLPIVSFFLGVRSQVGRLELRVRLLRCLGKE